MKFSQLFTKTTKQIPKDEVSKNSELLIRAGYVDKLMSGVYTYLPLGLRVLNKIKNIIRLEIDVLGGQEILMPALTPKENYEKTGRWDMDCLFKLKGVGDKEYALGATHEEIITPLIQKFASSYKDFPMAVYQIQDKFRNEPRAKSGILRGREFSMKDLYNFDIDEKRFDEFYTRAQQAYANIFTTVGLGDLTYLTYASGGAFSKYSHEYQTVVEVGEDTIHLCEACGVAINQEIIAEQKTCPVCGNDKLTIKNAVEVGNIFKLKTKFSGAFDFTAKDKDGDKQEVLMGCYGIGPSRVMGTVVEIYHDDRGIIWPEAIAPFKVHLLFIGKDNAEKETADKLYNDLQVNHIEVLYDDREEVGAGEKMADADLLGIPYRILISTKSLAENSVEYKKRAKGEAELVKIDKIIEKLK